MVWDMTKRDEMTEFDWKLVGVRHCRLHIPLGDRTMMRQVAEEIRHLARAMETAVDGPNREPMRRTLLRVRSLVNRANAEIQLLAAEFGAEIRDGRPRSSERDGNSMETDIAPSRRRPLRVGVE